MSETGMRRIGLIGGTFDPIHQGHVRPVRAACEACGLDRVLYLPTANPPHKRERRFAPAWARYAMVELALLGEDRLWVSDFEMTGDRPAYTIDTIKHFRALWPEVELYYLLGADAFAQLDTWRRWHEIPSLARLLVMTRPGELSATESGGEAPRRLPPPVAELLADDRVEIFENPPEEVSATQVRQRIAQREPVSQDMVPALVLDYIRKYKLYR